MPGFYSFTFYHLQQRGEMGLIISQVSIHINSLQDQTNIHSG